MLSYIITLLLICNFMQVNDVLGKALTPAVECNPALSWPSFWWEQSAYPSHRLSFSLLKRGSSPRPVSHEVPDAQRCLSFGKHKAHCKHQTLLLWLPSPLPQFHVWPCPQKPAVFCDQWWHRGRSCIGLGKCLPVVTRVIHRLCPPCLRGWATFQQPASLQLGSASRSALLSHTSLHLPVPGHKIWGPALSWGWGKTGRCWVSLCVSVQGWGQAELTCEEFEELGVGRRPRTGWGKGKHVFGGCEGS